MHFEFSIFIVSYILICKPDRILFEPSKANLQFKCTFTALFSELCCALWGRKYDIKGLLKYMKNFVPNSSHKLKLANFFIFMWYFRSSLHYSVIFV